MVGCLLLCSFARTQTVTDAAYGKQSNALVKLFERYHYEPVTLDKKLSKKIYWHFIHTLDPRGLYFSLADLNSLDEWQDKLDDEINNCSDYFLKQATAAFEKQLIYTDTLVSQLLARPTDFVRTDTIFFNRTDSILYTADRKALENRWRRFLKYDILLDLYTPDDSDKVNPFSMDVNELLKREPAVRAKLLKKTQRKINRLLKHPEGFNNYVATEYLNAITSCYDPHSEYFSDAGKDDFVSQLSADEFSFGISFEETDDGDIEIAHLVPGGAAWKSNQLNDHDILLKLKTSGNAARILPFYSITQAEDLLRTKTNRVLEFTVRKPNGEIRSVTLEKSKIHSDENAIKSYILQGDKKIGYISLPSFYTQWGSSSPLGCANDVAKEIVKLQEEHIDGLILDLRFNGGGSVYEAIGLAGLFIDEGPIVIFQERNEKPQLLKDMNRGTAYDGPLEIMVNGLSASASELFAGSIQDYNRGVIVGSATFGKATGQTIIPLDSIYCFPELFNGQCSASKAERKKMGYAKLTVEKFYNLHNCTHQRQGIHPDVPLPDPFYFNEYREFSLPGALACDSIVKKVFFHPLPALPIAQLANSSKERLAVNKNYNRFRQLNDSIEAAQKEVKKLILKPENFKKDEKKSYNLIESLEKTNTDSSTIFQARNNVYEQKVIEMDPYSKDTNKILLKNIQCDLFLEEGYNVLRDLINAMNK